jgi:hypothetical protein
MVNRKLKKKTLKKKSKNKTKKKYMNRRDIENLFMMSSFQKGGVDLHGGGLNVSKEIAPNPTSVTSLDPLMIHLQETSLSSTGSEPSSESEQREPHATSATGSQSREPILHQKTDLDYVPDEHINFNPSKDFENDKCKTLLQGLTDMLENIIRQFNSP